MTTDDLASVPDPLNMKIYLQPHVHLLRSGWPVGKVCSQGPRRRDTQTNLALQPEESFYLIYRNNAASVVQEISEGAYIFLEHLQSSAAFALAGEAALRAEPGLALDLLLAQFVQAGIFTRKTCA